MLARVANRLIFSRVGRWAQSVLWPTIALWAGRLRWVYAFTLLLVAVILLLFQFCQHGFADTPAPLG